MTNLLYEIGTEELPAGYLGPALSQLADQIERRLVEARLAPERVRIAGTPRRMCVGVEGIPQAQPGVTELVTGPPAGVAFDEEGNPTRAAEGFARSKGIDVSQLRVEDTDKGAYVVVDVAEPGRPAVELLPSILKDATAAITFPKSMHWSEDGFQFARPIRWLVALADEQVLPLILAGLTAGRTTNGHPFLAPGEIELADASFDDYVHALREHDVLVDRTERRRLARHEIASVLAAHGGGLRDEALVEEVTDMVEYPHAVEGCFDERFLEVPAPVLCAAMKGHQRYFPVYNADGDLEAGFVTLANRRPAQDMLVRQGNERVLRARLNDAEFFWNEDSLRRLEDLVPRLADVVFLGGLGDNLRRTDRLCELSGRIAEMVAGVHPGHVQRAAYLCKADLLTGLVGEFPDLQGVVGREIALANGEPAIVAEAIAEHYLPAGADTVVPETAEGAVLALADKIDVIVGCFALGLLPTGSQDPYALRRNALGILLIIERKGLELHLGRLIDASREVLFADGAACDDEAVKKVREFFRDRLYNAALERGYRHDFVRAVLASGYDDVNDFWGRLAALAECAEENWWGSLVELVDRTYRIQRDIEVLREIRNDLLGEPAEIALAGAFNDARDKIETLCARGRYVEAADAYTTAFATLVHDFFEEVFVNVEDDDMRMNRKSLLGHVYRLFADRFADLYFIETAEG